MSEAPEAELPEPLHELIEGWIAGAGVEGRAADRVREDLESHFRDGLEAGRTVDELIAAFGSPAGSAPLLARSARRLGGSGVVGVPHRPLSGLAGDLRLAIRGIRAAPLHSLAVVLVLALGIGANVLTFTILDEVLLEPLPVQGQATLVNVIAEVPGGNSFTGFSVHDFATLRSDNDVLEGLVAYAGARLRLGEDGSGGEVFATLASPGYFQLLGVAAAAGSVSLPEFTGWGADPVAVVSERFWRTRLGADPEVVGSTLLLDGRTVVVQGVAAPPFTGTFIGFAVDLWMPLSMADAFVPRFDPDDRGFRFLELLGRRRAGVSVAEVDRGLDRIAVEIEQLHPIENRGHRVRVVSLTGIDDSMRVGVLGFVTTLTAFAVLVLVISCLNVGGLLLVRTMARERNLMVRLALGAGRRRIAAQILAELGLLATLATLLALAGATVALGGISDALTLVSGGLGLQLELDRSVLALTTLAALVAVVTIGLAPIGHLLRRAPAEVLRRGRAGGRVAGFARRALVVSQLATSVVLVVGAGLFGRALLAGLRTDPGFDPDVVSTVAVHLDAERFGPQASMVAQRELVSRVRSLPGIEAAALSGAPPLGVGRIPSRVVVPGVEPPPGETAHVVESRRVASGYFATLGVELLSGRAFEPLDDRVGASTVVVSRSFAERFAEGGELLGRSLDVDGTAATVVGIVEDVQILIQDPRPEPIVYRAWSGAVDEVVQLSYRASIPHESVRRPIEEIVRSLDPTRPALRIRTARELLGVALLPQRIGVAAVGAMSVLALLLASMGLYGLIQYGVTREAHELGIRMALGGSRAHVLGSVLGAGYRVVATGLAIGVGTALLLAPALRPFLGPVDPYDPPTYVLVVVIFSAVATLAALGPGLRATRIDPIRSLRAE